MKRLYKLALASLLTVPFFTGCEFLQGTLSSSQEAALAEATGSPSYAYKTWYYNGYAGEDMTQVVENELYAESLKIDFGKQVSYETLNGSISVSYTDSNGNSRTDVTKDIRGRLSADYTSFYLDMSYVLSRFDGTGVTSGTASVDIKLSGFICAEGNQKGRKLKTFELNKLQVKPLYEKTEYTLSTVGFEQSETKFPFVLNGEFSLENETVVATDSALNTYEFSVCSSESILYLVPEFECPSDGIEATLSLTGLIPNGTGSAYEKEMSLSFSAYSIIVDGIKDENYSSAQAASVEDASGDAYTDGYDAASDITAVYVTNDDEYLYVAVEGSLSVEWYDGIGILVSKDHSYDVHSDSAVDSGKEGYRIADNVSWGRETLAHGKPDFYLFHRPYFDTLKAWVEDSGSALEISSVVKASEITKGSFVEYAIPMSELSKAGISSGDTLYILAAFSAHWNEGVYLSDAAPSSAVTTGEGTLSAVINFKNALEFTLN